MSPDPLGGNIGDPQSQNRYAYVRNNPLTFTDPTGMTLTDGDSDGCDPFSGCGGVCLLFCGGEGGGTDRQPPIYSPPDPGTTPNPSAGDPDPDGPFSGPIWQEGGPQIPLRNLAQILGVPSYSPFIINNIISKDAGGNMVSDTYGDELSVLIDNVWSSLYWNGHSWLDADSLHLQELSTQIVNDGANEHFIFGGYAGSLAGGSLPALYAGASSLATDLLALAALNPDAVGFVTDFLGGALSPTPGPFTPPGLLGNILPNMYGDNPPR